MRTFRDLGLGGLVALGAMTATPVLAQRPDGGEAAVQRLIDQLQPRAATRGIRIPGEGPGVPPRAEPVTPTTRPAPDAVSPRPSPPRITAAGVAPRTTTAPEGMAAVSMTIFFQTGSAEITHQAERDLAALGRALISSELSPYRFRIEGHTDSVGGRDSNQVLSERRAAAVRDLLVRRYGIAPERLEAVGFGEDQLLVGTADETPERRNRRVQVVNLGG